MKSLNFCYWLQGYFEVLAAGGDPDAALTPEQVACIKDHLAMVLTKQTPVRGKPVKAPKAASVAVGITLGALAGKMNVKATDILMRLLGMGMTGVHINTILDADTVKALAKQYGWGEYAPEKFKIDFDPFTQPGVTCAGDEQKPVEIDWVAPPVNPNQVRLDIEAEVKKGLEPPKPKTGAEYWAGRDRGLGPVRTYCAWTGGGRSQKVC